jgi:membrane protein required for colicin V production
MTVVDWIIIAILAASVLGGITQGFLRSVFSLGGLLLGLVVAAWNYESVAAFIKTIVHNKQVANAVSFFLIALTVTAAAAVFGVILSKAFHKLGLGCLDRLAGAFFGFFQGALLVTVCILVTVAFFPETEWLTQSRLPRHFFAACHLSTQITPSMLAEQVRNSLNRLERESPGWMHPGKPAR